MFITRKSMLTCGLAVAFLILPAIPGSADGNRVVAQTSIVSLQPSPMATFKWAMPERFGKKKNGVVEYHWDPEKQSYDSDYVNPDKWKVDFNACDSRGGSSAVRQYTWTIDGELITTLDKCSFTHEFEDLGNHWVKLTVTNESNQSVSKEISVPVKDYLIVSIGDSIASGEGAPDIPKGEGQGVAWVYTRCHRSARSGHAQAALEVERDDPRTSVTFLSFACSGAGLRDGLDKSQKKGLKELPAQMEQVKRISKLRRIDALIITIGANDANFSRLVARAIFKDDASTDKGTLALFEKGLSTLEKRYADLNDHISTIFWRPKVFITEYPDIARKSVDRFCDREPKDDRLRKVSAAEARWAAETVVVKLNAAVSTAASKYGWTYVDKIAEAFFDHGYCTDGRWINTFKDAKKIQGTKGCTKSSLIHCIVSAGSLHPNHLGQNFFAQRLGTALNDAGIGLSPAQ